MTLADLRLRLRSPLARLWNRDVDEALKPVRKDVRELARRLEGLEALLRETAESARRADRIALVEVLDRRQRARVADLPRLLDAAGVARHVRAAIDAAPLLTTPYEHMVVEDVLPRETYDLLLEAIPPEVYFDGADRIKRNLRFPMEVGPALSADAWGFFDAVIARQVIRPAVLERFRGPLDRHFDSMFGPAFRERAHALPQAVSGGRLMLRRAGYHLGPHRDPKHSMLTCLLYLARPGDSETFGTQIFSVADDGDAGYKQTYYPEQDGKRCELVKVVPFKANSMLVFLNSRGAHGATIPADAPASLERYSYQFYVAPEKDALASLVKSLPPERRARWISKADREDGG
jgi:hypothetical protein